MNHSNKINQKSWNASSGTLTLPAQLGIQDLPNIIKQNKWLELPVTKVDFSHVEKADSAILSVLLHWAKNQQVSIKVVALPEALLSLIELYDLQEIIHLETSAIN